MKPLYVLALSLSSLFALGSMPAVADISTVIEQHIQPGHQGFAQATATLSEAAHSDCTAASLAPYYQASFDAWMAIGHLQLGPVSQGDRAQAIYFWPDKKNFTAKALGRLIRDQDQIVQNPAQFPEVSVAARGLMALERVLFDAALNAYGQDDYTCALVQAIAGDLATSAAVLNDAWQSSAAATLRSAGADDNQTYLSQREAVQALYTTLTTGLTFTHDQRLGRPLGNFDRPRPNRAEARRAGRSLRNVALSLHALQNLSDTLTNGQATLTRAAFDRAIAQIENIDQGDFSGVSTPIGRLKIEILQQHVAAVQLSVAAEVGPMLGVSAGFNALDGD